MKPHFLNQILMKGTICLTIFAVISQADIWYKIPLTTFSWIQTSASNSNYNITLTQAAPNWDKETIVYPFSATNSNGTGTAGISVKYILISTGDINLYKAWLAQILSGKQSGSALWVYSPDPVNKVLHPTQIALE